MTDREFKELHDALRGMGYHYDPSAELFKDAKGKVRGWESVLVALPYLCLNDLEAYEEHAQAKFRRARANAGT